MACDVVAYDYLPLLDEMGYVPRNHYAKGAEILEHCRAIATRYGLYELAVFQTTVTSTAWDEQEKLWRIGTDRGDQMKARFVICANGTLSKPKLAKIEGMESFEGHSFHTSRWDYDYTGDDLSKLQDKVVGIIGTGASAVQSIPRLGPAAKELYVFQRTPSSIDIKDDWATDPEWAKRLKPGWQARRRAEALAPPEVSPEKRAKLAVMSRQEKIRRQESANIDYMMRIHRRIEETVEDPQTAEALKPWYRQFCKRPCFHDDYLTTFERDNVTLVDTQGEGVERITERGVVVAGTEYELDCLIFGTGFEVGTDYSRRAGCEIVGRDGLTLAEKWKDGLFTLHGLQTHSFPNLILMGGQQSGVTPNFTELYNEQSHHIAYIIGEAIQRGATTFEASAEAEAAWVRVVEESSYRNEGFAESCTPGYYNNEGRPNEGPGWWGGTYGGGALAFFQLLRDWREKGDLEGLVLK